MKEWTGKIETLSEKDWNNIVLYSFQIEGENRWFRTGRTQIPFAEGDTVQFVERNNQVVEGSVKAAVASIPATAPAPAATPSAPVGASAGPKPDVGQRIAWEAARRDACNVIVAALHTEALPWAANVAKAKKLDLLRGYIKQLTLQFLEDEHDQ